MQKTSRRSLLKAAGASGIAAGLGIVAKGEKDKPREKVAQDHDHKPISGPLSNATVSFGSWQSGPTAASYPGTAGPEFDRTDPAVAGPPPTGGPNDRFRNVHQVIPFEVTIKEGGSVNFIVAGFHQITIYGNGKQLSDVSTAVLVAPNPPGLIDDPVDRVFRGVSPATTGLSQDRVEVVNFPNQGVYLVICAVLPHFRDKMHGWVKVVP